MVPSLFLSWPIEVLGNEMAAKFLYFVTVLLGVATFLSGVASWYWIGSRFDRQWILKDRTPWIALSIFTLVALAGSLLDLGTSGYLLFGAVLWILWAVVVSRISRGEAWLRRSSKA